MAYKLCSTKFTCECLGIHPKTLMAWFGKGLIGGVKVEGQKNKHRYLIDLAGYLIKNGVDPELYLKSGEDNARQRRGLGSNIRPKNAFVKGSRGKPD